MPIKSYMDNSNKPFKTKNQKLLIIDSHALLHRAFHALPALTNSKGEPINAIYGFASILIKILAEIKPDYLVACFDLPKPTLRHNKFPEYKAKRPKVHPDLIKQFILIRRLLKNLDIPILEKEGYEADDAIGTVITQMEAKHSDIENIVLTGDLDTLQLINGRTKILTPRHGLSESVLYDERKLKERFDGISPAQVIEFKGLKGDPSDNIPGVPGVGEKTALKLVKKFGTLEKIYQALEDEETLKKLKEEKLLGLNLISKLKENKDLAFFSRELSTIYRDVPINFNLKDAIWQPDYRQIEDALLDFGFRSLVKRFTLLLEGKEIPKFRKIEKKQEEKPRKAIVEKSKQSKLF